MTRMQFKETVSADMASMTLSLEINNGDPILV
jgi:hypothetical protein